MTHAEAARTFRVGSASVGRYLRRWREGQLAATEQRRGRLPLISEEGLEEVRSLLLEHPDDTTSEVADAFAERTGIRVSRPTMDRAFGRLRYSRKKSSSVRKSGTQSGLPRSE
jgi:transposase